MQARCNLLRVSNLVPEGPPTKQAFHNSTVQILVTYSHCYVTAISHETWIATNLLLFELIEA